MLGRAVRLGPILPRARQSALIVLAARRRLCATVPAGVPAAGAPEAGAEPSTPMDEAPMDEAPMVEAPMVEAPMDEAPMDEAFVLSLDEPSLRDECTRRGVSSIPSDSSSFGHVSSRRAASSGPRRACC